MYRFFSSIFHGRGSSLISHLAPKPKPKPALQSIPALPPCRLPQNDGHVRGFSSSNFDWRRINMSQNVNADANAHPNFMQDTENKNSRNWNNVSQNVNADSNALPNFTLNSENMNSRRWNNLGQNVNANANANALPDFMQDKENTDLKGKNDAETGGNARPMDFVRGIIEEDNFLRGAAFQYHYEQDADFVHIKMLRNNTFVTVTDSKGNIKLSGSAGSLKDLKSGQKLSRYAAEATAEVVGRRARGLGLKSVVMKVNGFTHFTRKRNAILSWKEGFTADSRGNRSPIVYIEDTTRKPHNGCRLPKKRRI